MHFFIHFTIALISLIAIVLSCVLFTNAIEYLGNNKFSKIKNTKIKEKKNVNS